MSMVVHQCARYCSALKAIHELKVKQIANYLLTTQTKGLILHPTAEWSLNMYVDADFSGLWHNDYAKLLESVLSRIDYEIMFCGCPITCAVSFKALSTAKSKYIALSMATRDIMF
jgi:hypothetical protein